MSEGQVELVGWRVPVAAQDEAVRAEPDPAARPELGRTGVPVWPHDAAYRFEVEVQPTEPEGRVVDTDGDGTLTMRRVGRVELLGGDLDVWSLAQYGGGLFVPLRDATAGAETYGGGRYVLDTTKGSWLGGEGDTLVIDLDVAHHPSCGYDPRRQCPLASQGNVLAARVEAGERLP